MWTWDFVHEWSLQNITPIFVATDDASPWFSKRSYLWKVCTYNSELLYRHGDNHIKKHIYIAIASNRNVPATGEVSQSRHRQRAAEQEASRTRQSCAWEGLEPVHLGEGWKGFTGRGKTIYTTWYSTRFHCVFSFCLIIVFEWNLFLILIGHNPLEEHLATYLRQMEEAKRDVMKTRFQVMNILGAPSPHPPP